MDAICGCKSHALEVEYWDDDGMYVLYIWYRQDTSVFHRIKKAWQLLRFGKVIIDDIILVPEEMDKFIAKVREISPKEPGCTKCNSSKLTWDGTMRTSMPPKYAHTCEDCGNIEYLREVAQSG